MADAFKPGDVVQLKSGGPKMTVSSLEEGGKRVYCRWFAGSKMEGGYFGSDILVKIVATDETKRG
jgi:uncharacterized protein YodC (DUF2158 family)